jgi:phosphatidate cytidylyltransferase
MPLNKEVFKTRAITAVVFVVVMCALLLWNHWSFFALFLVVHAGCWWEYARLSAKIENLKLHSWVVEGCILSGMAIMLAFAGNAFSWGSYPLAGNLMLPFAVAGFLLMAMGIMHRSTVISFRGMGWLALGWVYISISWGTMLGLRQYGIDSMLGDMGRMVPVLLIGSIWVNDTMAYIAGSIFGKTPLSAISPKKTWEGTLIGAALAIAVVALAARFGFKTSWPHALVIPAIGAIAGTLGDLWESKLKRMAGVKDSGNFMPGHGGFLDRFDSMLVATPVCWLWITLAG